MSAASTPVGQRPAGYRDVLGVGEFRVVWLAHAQSRLGDQLARVAIAVLVYDRTSSPLWTAGMYALTLLPPLLSAPLLSGLADRYARRSVLVTVDLCRCSLVGLMALPGVPLWGMAVLLVAMVSLQPLYSAARNAILPRVLEGERYVLGLGLANITDAIAQVAGFAFGGLLLTLVGPRAALGIDAATFALSVALVGLGVGPHRPARDPAEVGPAQRPSARWSVLGGFASFWGDARLRNLALLSWLYGFYIAPEGVAAPYAAQVGAGAAAVGLLMAADPVGQGVGAVVLSRWVGPERRARLIGPLAVGAGVPLVVSALHPSVGVAIVLWAATGALSSYLMLALAEFTLAVPDHRRGRAVGPLGAGLQAAQGLGIVGAGALASQVAPSTAVGLCGIAGTVCALLLARARSNSLAADPVEASDELAPPSPGR
jgi:MFS family permease